MGVATWGECRRCHRTCRFYEGGLCSRCWEREGRMTEADWLACDDPARMLDFVCGHRDHRDRERFGFPVSDRKLRLYACACCRASDLGHLVDRYAWEESGPWPVLYWAQNWAGPISNPRVISGEARAGMLRHIIGNPFRPVTLCGLERKPFHNQFAHVDANGSFWLEAECPVCTERRTHTVAALAAALYEGGDCAHALHDALLEAGAPAEMVEHFGTCPACTDKTGFCWGTVAGCRTCEGTGEYPHQKGCWALDAILGKE